MIVSIAIGLALGLIGIGVLGMLVSGVKSMKNGKQDFKKIITMFVPFLVFGGAYAITGNITEAGVATMLFMMAAMVLLIVLTGMRGTFNI